MKYADTKPGEWLAPKLKGYRTICCDCSLVHEWDFKLIRCGRGKQIVFRVRRNNRATAAARRTKQVKR